MNHVNSLSKNTEMNRNAKLYEFLSTRYDINNMASKIAATKNSSGNILSLKKRVSGNNITA